MLKLVKDLVRKSDVSIGQEYSDKVELLFRKMDEYPITSPKRLVLGAGAGFYLAVSAKHFFSTYPE